MTLENLQPANLDQLTAISEGAAALETLAEIEPLLRALGTADADATALTSGPLYCRPEQIQTEAYQRARTEVYGRLFAAQDALRRFARGYVAVRVEDS